ncbi:hypothetical protein A7K99_04295 [Tatumella citrea]|uniref:Pectate lyase superfamily protein domain-containing protein n=2 Tax=Tatumella citrea TaxID=53336 RepID=A0A1Y0L537_TATCI|nr:hypothetical protein A7K98_04295 [Tatumella citrea]ARU97125.1 hypothetical protein A7K99_04295 [Tatumella citrea]
MIFSPAASSSLWEQMKITKKKILTVDEFNNLSDAKEGDVVFLNSYSKNTERGGGYFKLVSSKNKKIDNGITFESNFKDYVWCRIGVVDYITPEWFGCLGDGETDDGPAFNRCLSSLKPGNKLVLRKNATYFNGLKNNDSKWIIEVNDIEIISDNSTLRRRGTYGSTYEYLYGNLSTLEIRGSNLKFHGSIIIDGGEDDYFLVDKKNNSISNLKFSRGSTSSHALYIESAKDIMFNGMVHCKNAVFPCYINKSCNIYLNGEFVNSGQVFPVRGNDLQLGSCIKISASNNVTVNAKCKMSAYSGCEIEPRSTNVNINLITENCFFYGVIIHDHSSKINLSLKSDRNIKGAGLRVSDGSKSIKGDIYVSNSGHAVIISSFDKDICEDVVLNVYPTNISGDIIQAFNTKISQRALESSDIKVFYTERRGSIPIMPKKSNEPQIQYFIK